MTIVTGDRYLNSLVKFVEYQAERLIEGTLVLKLNPVSLRYVQSRLEALAELESLLAGAPVDYFRAYVTDLGDHRAIEQLRRILRLLPSLKLVSVLPPPGRDPTPLYLFPFGRLKVLELRGCDLSASEAKGLLELRFTLEKLICHNSTDALRHVFSSRIADIRDSPKWNRLSFVSCACNRLVLMDESLQLLPVIETLDLSRNKFAVVDNLRKCTKLKLVDLGFNNLRSIASLSGVSCQIVKLVLRNNALTSLHGIENLRSLQGLDISYNIISNFSNIEILAGFSSLENLWLDGNPICYARWFRPQVFSLFLHPDRLKLDEKKISTTELWKRKIIIASRQEQPASFGFYSPVQDYADMKGSVDAKRVGNQMKRTSRLVDIEDSECDAIVCSDQDSVSCDNQSQRKEENVNIDQEAEFEDLMAKIELLKKDHSVLWLQEFKEWMNQTSKSPVVGNDFTNTILHKNKGMHLSNKSMYEALDSTSRHISNSFQLSGDESSTIILESETSFADTSTVDSAQRYSVGNKFLFKIFKVNQEDPEFFSSEGNPFVDAGGSLFNSLVVPSGETVTNENDIPTPVALNGITGAQSSSVCAESPPHYQDDLLLRRQNLEEEILQLSAESFSVASSDSNTSCEDNSSDIDISVAHDYRYVLENPSEWSQVGFFVDPHHDGVGNDYDEKITALKPNGTHMSSLFAERNFVRIDDRELDISLSVSSSSSNALHDNEDLGFVNRKTDCLEMTKYRKKPRRRMISLPEEEDAQGDLDLPEKSSDNIETCRCDLLHQGQEILFSSDLLKSSS